MFCDIKDQDISTDRHCRNDIRILRLISCPINFSFMYNFLTNRNATFETSVASKFYVNLWNMQKTYLLGLHRN